MYPFFWSFKALLSLHLSSSKQLFSFPLSPLFFLFLSPSAHHTCSIFFLFATHITQGDNDSFLTPGSVLLFTVFHACIKELSVQQHSSSVSGPPLSWADDRVLKAVAEDTSVEMICLYLLALGLPRVCKDDESVSL